MNERKLTIRTYLGGPIDAAEDRGVHWRQKIKPQFEELERLLRQKFPEISIEFVVQDPIETTEISFERQINKVHEYLAELRKYNEEKFVEEVFDKIVVPDIKMVENLAKDGIGFGTIYFAPDTPTSGTHCEIWEGCYYRDIPFYIITPSGLLGIPAWIHSIISRKGGKIFYNFSQFFEFLRIWLPKKVEEKLNINKKP